MRFELETSADPVGDDEQALLREHRERVLVGLALSTHVGESGCFHLCGSPRPMRRILVGNRWACEALSEVFPVCLFGFLKEALEIQQNQVADMRIPFANFDLCESAALCV